MIGTDLGPYRVVEKLGEGGMGEVYRARDSRLGRDVAIKMSKVAFDDRFQREAHAIAALNHPNVCTLYDIGPNYLVMEYVDGITLADRLREGAVPEAEALAIAIEIASALEAAHEKGVVHRDLKPANIKITADGHVKVLDFGLAKAMGPVDATPAGGNADSPTMASPAMTTQGLILGTVGYMAPEQARGQVVDKRADIWAFGVVLWEMLAGRQLFAGETTSDLVAAVLKEEPRWDAVPPRVRPLLRRCLEKDPRKRLHDIADARLWLDEVPAAGALPPTGFGRYARWLLPVAVAAIVAATPWIWRGQAAVRPIAFQFTVYAPPGVNLPDAGTGVAVSRDGRAIVFRGSSGSSEGHLYVHNFASGETQPLPGTGYATEPLWSPDGHSVAFLVGTKLKRLSLSGGSSEELGDVPPDAVAGFWDNGFIVLGSGTGVWRFPEARGRAEQLTRIEEGRGEVFHGHPQTLFDGKRFIYSIQSLNTNVRGLYLGSFDAPEERQLLVTTSAKGLFSPGGSGERAALLYLREDTLVAQSLDMDRGQLTGEPSTVVASVRRTGGLGPGQAAFWIAPDGLLVYRQSEVTNRTPLVWISREARRQGEVAPPQQGRFSSFFLSPDDKRISADLRDAAGVHDVWIHEFASGMWDRQTSNPANDFLAVWSPEGDRLVFGSSRTGVSQLYLTAPGSRREEPITDGPLRKYPLQWTRDLLLFRGTDVAHPVGNLWALAVDGDRKAFAVAQDQYDQFTGQISPDGKWIAYQSTKLGIDEIYLQKFQGTGDSIKISNGGGRWPKWRRTDGLELYYVSPSDAMMAVSLTPSGDKLVPATARELFRSSFEGNLTYPYDVTRDGKRFLALERQSSAGRFDVMTNWRASVQR
jgi:Tol biopolymer transport system component/predicted Ser/Thr protein kinase